VDVVGKADRTGASQRLQASGDIDSVTVDVALTDNNVTDVDADAQFDPAIFRSVGVALSHGALDFRTAPNCINHARKFDQSTVTRSFDDAAAMLSNLRIDKFVSMCLKRRESAFLVNTHQAAVSGNIGREDGSQPPFDTRLGHKYRPKPP
jgi:hypothetical protein